MYFMLPQVTPQAILQRLCEVLPKRYGNMKVLRHGRFCDCWSSFAFVEVTLLLLWNRICLRLPIRPACYFASGFRAGLTFGVPSVVHWHCFLQDSLCSDQTFSAGSYVILQLPFRLPTSRLFPPKLSFYHSISFSCFSWTVPLLSS